MAGSESTSQRRRSSTSKAGSSRTNSSSGCHDTNNVTRGEFDVAILNGATPFVLTCQEAQAYKRWYKSLRDAVTEYKTWTSFRRGVNVREYFEAHVGDQVRFLKGNDGARNDAEADWKVLSEVETMQKSKEAFQDIEKASRHVAAWHGVTVEKVIRTEHDVPLMTPGYRSAFADECKKERVFAIYERAMKKAIQNYNRSWSAFRRSGGILGYFQTEMGEDTRILRAKNEAATSDDDANWEELSGEPLTAFMENQFRYYACLVPAPEATPEKAAVKPASAPKSAPPATTSGVAAAAQQEEAAEGKAGEVEKKPEKPASSKKRRQASSSGDDSEDSEPQKVKKRSKGSVPMPVSKPREVARKEYKPIKSETDADEEPSRHITCSIFLLSKAIALALGRIDVKVKTKWTLQRLREEIDPVLRQKQYLTLNAAWEFYFHESGSFVSRSYEDRLNIAEYLLEANQSSSMSIRVV